MKIIFFFFSLNYWVWYDINYIEYNFHYGLLEAAGGLVLGALLTGTLVTGRAP
jgi:hypothetical protein